MGRTPLGSWGIIGVMARIGDYATAPDVAPAGWVTAGLRGVAGSVVSVVPAGFPAYARIFHPAQRRDGVDWKPVSWREVASANGRVAHRTMQWCRLVGCCSLSGDDCRPQPGVWDVEPATGDLPRDLAIVLAEVLAEQTTTPSDAGLRSGMALVTWPCPMMRMPGRSRSRSGACCYWPARSGPWAPRR